MQLFDIPLDPPTLVSVSTIQQGSLILFSPAGKTTLLRRCSNVLTSYQHPYNVVLTSYAGWDRLPKWNATITFSSPVTYRTDRITQTMLLIHLRLRWPGLSLGPFDYKVNTLPTELTGHKSPNKKTPK